MKHESNFIFYYPSYRGAPSSVGINIFEQLLKKRNGLPFEDICIFTPSTNERYLKSKFEDVTLYTEKSILRVPSGVVHIPISPHLFPNSKFLLHIYAKLNKSKLIFNYHGDIRKEFIFNYKNNRSIDYSYIPTYIFLPSLLKSTDQLIVHSHLFKNLVSEKYGVKNAKVIPNAIEDYWYTSQSQLIPKKKGTLEIFFHGRLSAEKGVDLLLKGFKKFLSNRNESEALLYIAGNGPQKNDLKKLINILKLHDNVFLLGNIDKDTIKGYLKMVDGAIYPSRWDNFPLSYIEAFACANCPVYFSKRSGIYDFVITDNKKLYSFDPQIDVICNIITDISKKDTDKRIIEEQKSFASKYNWDNIIKDYINTYSQFCS